MFHLVHRAIIWNILTKLSLSKVWYQNFPLIQIIFQIQISTKLHGQIINFLRWSLSIWTMRSHLLHSIQLYKKNCKKIAQRFGSFGPFWKYTFLESLGVNKNGTIVDTNVDKPIVSKIISMVDILGFKMYTTYIFLSTMGLFSYVTTIYLFYLYVRMSLCMIML